MKQKKMKIVKCADVAKHVCENLDEQIDSPLCRKIKKHLQECPNCTNELIYLKKTIALYRKTPNPRFTHSTHQKLLSALKFPKTSTI
jgi:hypothetical protein